MAQAQDSSVDEIKRNCIVGWNDVLGFGSVLEQNDVSYLQEHVLLLLKDIKRNRVGTTLKDLAHHDDVKGYLGFVEVHVVSDTIALTCPIGKVPWASWVAFLVYSATLHMEMFAAGLPLRGAVSVGDIILSDWCIFGRPVAAGHNATTGIDISASWILPSAVDSVQQAFHAPGAMPSQVRELLSLYTLPTECAAQGQIPRFVQLFNRAFFLGPDREDLGRYVIQRFAEHGKSVDSPDVQRKIANTLAFLQWNRSLLVQKEAIHG